MHRWRNRRAGEEDDLDESRYDTAGLVSILNNWDKSLGFNLDQINSINSTDKFFSFYRKDQNGTTRMVGWVEALGASDFDAIPNWGAVTLARTARNFYSIWEFDIQTTPFSEWIKYSDSGLMKISRGMRMPATGIPPAVLSSV